MKIDTYYRPGKMICTMDLDGDSDEVELGDDLLARVACNQHRLAWTDGAGGIARLGGKDPSSFRIPSGYGDWTVKRERLRATVTFEVTS